MEVEAYTVHEYISSLKNAPGLLDLVAKDQDSMEEDASTQRFIYEPHWSNEKIRAGIKSGKLRQGALKTSRSNYLEANIMVEGFEKSVLIQGRLNINRAIHDDTVAVEIFSKDQWS